MPSGHVPQRPSERSLGCLDLLEKVRTNGNDFYEIYDSDLWNLLSAYLNVEGILGAGARLLTSRQNGTRGFQQLRTKNVKIEPPSYLLHAIL